MGVLGKITPEGNIFRILLLRFNRSHRLTFSARISCRSVPLQRKASSLYTRYKTLTFSPPFCASLAQGANILS